jgi:hypothetical protein
MGHEVFANGMELVGKASSSKSICSFPDVCFTPPQTPATPPGVPIPYPNTGLASDTTDGSSSVKATGEETMLKSQSNFKSSSGDEAGCAPKKGMINSKISGKVFFVSWSMDVKIEGQNVDRHLDLTTHNHGSTANDALSWPQVGRVAMVNVNDKPCPKNCKPDTDKAYDNLRKKSPTRSATKKMNKRIGRPRICVGCKESKRKLTADHVFPLAELVKMPGFACLPEKDQKRIANDQKNFAGMCGSCNSSKQDTLWKDWKENKAGGYKIHASTRAKGERVAHQSKRHLEKEVRKVDCP